MISPVIIKGNNQGIRLVISKDASFECVLQALRNRLKTTKHYYKNVKPIAITFDGKKLTEDEQETIIEELTDIGLNIETKQDKQPQIISETVNLQHDKDGLFFIGNLKSGQSIDATKSIVIIGNIEQGASIYSEGNIIIVGNLYGYAKAGSKGKNNSFVYCLSKNIDISGRN